MLDARVGDDEGTSVRLMRRVMALASDILEVFKTNGQKCRCAEYAAEGPSRRTIALRRAGSAGIVADKWETKAHER